MSIKITWVLEARLDLEYYVDWYTKQAGKTIVRGLITSIQEDELLIKNNPRIAKRVAEEDELREFVMQKYPFLISYLIKDEQEIVITSLLHSSKKNNSLKFLIRQHIRIYSYSVLIPITISFSFKINTLYC